MVTYLSGNTRYIPLNCIVKLIINLKKTVKIYFTNYQLEGELNFNKGKITHAICGHCKGEKAFFMLFYIPFDFQVIGEYISDEITIARETEVILAEVHSEVEKFQKFIF